MLACSLSQEGSEDSDCQVVKRDPHDQKLIGVAIEDTIRIVDLRK